MIEVIIATSILTISVFWVYKLIWENTKIITNSSNFIQANYIFPIFEECIENIWFNSYMQNIWQEYFFNFWNDKKECKIWTNNGVIIDNLEYILKWKIINYWTWFIDWELSVINDGMETLTWVYFQIKK